jgi:hypothetical protein
MMAAGRPRAGRDYPWRGARRIILRSGDIIVRNTPTTGRCVRGRAFVPSGGIGGTDGFRGTVPLGDGRSRVVAGPGSESGAAGSGMVSSLGTWGPPQRPRGPLGSGRPERCDGEWVGARPRADAQQGRRQLPTAAAQGGRSRAGRELLR